MYGPKKGHATLHARSCHQVIGWARAIMEVDNQATKFDISIEYGGLRFILPSTDRKEFSDKLEDMNEIDFWAVIGATD
jgi:hypothetical protein